MLEVCTAVASHANTGGKGSNENNKAAVSFAGDLPRALIRSVGGASAQSVACSLLLTCGVNALPPSVPHGSTKDTAVSLHITTQARSDRL